VQHDHATRRDDGYQERMGLEIEGMLHNGVDSTAVRRAHMRALTAARQAAERSQSRHAAPVSLDGAAEHDAARTAAMYAEIARLTAEHRAWQREQGEEVQDRPRRRRATISRDSYDTDSP